MDLDTKLKNIKIQKASRVISFLLALVFIVVGMLNGIEVVKSAYLFGFGDCLSNDLTVYDMNGFENDFRTDVTSVLAWSNRNYMQKQVEKKKTEFIDGMLSKYLESKSFYDANSQALQKSYNDEYNDKYYDEDDESDVDMTTLHRCITFNMNMMSLEMMFSTFKRITRKNFQQEDICGLPVLSRFHIQTNR